MSNEIQTWFNNFLNIKCHEYPNFNFSEVLYLWKCISEYEQTPSIICLSGYLTMHGLGVKKNTKDAYENFLFASKSNHSEAIFWLGIMYFNGIYVRRDIPRGINLIKKAAKLKNINASNDLASFYVSGRDIEQNIPKAIALYTFAAQNNSKLALLNLQLLSRNNLCSVEQMQLTIDPPIMVKRKTSFISRMYNHFFPSDEKQTLL